MPLVKIGLDVAGEKQLARAFELSEREAADMTEPLTRFGQHLIREIGEQFGSEGARGGDAWAPLDRAYAAWKDEHYPGRPLLVRTGALRGAALSPDAVTVTPTRLVYEIDGQASHATPSGHTETEDVGAVAYFHQKGKGRLPERKIVDLNEAARRQIDRFFAEWINAIRRHQGIGPR